MGDATVEGRRHQFHVETLALSATASLLRRERIFQLRHMKRTQANHLSFQVSLGRLRKDLIFSEQPLIRWLRVRYFR